MENFMRSFAETILTWGFGFMVLVSITVFFYSIFAVSNILGLLSVLLFIIRWVQRYKETSKTKVFVKDQFKI